MHHKTRRRVPQAAFVRVDLDHKLVMTLEWVDDVGAAHWGEIQEEVSPVFFSLPLQIVKKRGERETKKKRTKKGEHEDTFCTRRSTTSLIFST